MLVLCYTNHALDQFLEGLSPFLEEGDMIRVGERSTNETLKKYGFKVIRGNCRNNSESSRKGRQMYFSTRDEVNSIKTKLDVEFKKIEILQENIVSEESLKEEMEPCYYKQIEKLNGKNVNSDELDEQFTYIGKSRIIQWLGILNMAKKIYKDCNHVVKSRTTLKNNVKTADKKCVKPKTPESPEIKQFKEENLALDINKLHESKEEYKDADKKRIEEDSRSTISKLLKRKLETIKPMPLTEATHEDNIIGEHFSEERRWSLYLNWVQRKCNSIYESNVDRKQHFEEASLNLNDVKKANDISVLKNAKIVGMTITGAAMHKDILDEIKPVITIVEEAAQVFESNLITTLTSGCEHLIMIGDHQQLRPKPNVYRLEKEYDMDISLFERMILNGFKYQQLETQHRMRPEIADNVRMFYKNLQDHESVKQYESVKGIVHNIFFIDHCIDEQNVNKPGNYTNDHEVSCIFALCNYLFLQGYDASRISILTTYNSQLDLMKKEARKYKNVYKDVYMATVDGFQGEENDIILLSLVRSNNNGNIGFVKESNRVCVALSRAKIGFYIVGNSNCLSEKSKLWRNILNVMKERGQIGGKLHLRCKNHSDNNGNMVKLPEDLEAVSREYANFLNDGHCCKDICYAINLKHHHTKLREVRCCRDYRKGDQFTKECNNKCISKTIRSSDDRKHRSSRSLRQSSEQVMSKYKTESSSKRPASVLTYDGPDKKRLRRDNASTKRKRSKCPEMEKHDNEPKKKLHKTDENVGAYTSKRYFEESPRNPNRVENGLSFEHYDSRIVKMKTSTVAATEFCEEFRNQVNKQHTVTLGSVQTKCKEKSLNAHGNSLTTRDVVEYADVDMFENNDSEGPENSDKKNKHQRSLITGDLRNKIPLTKMKYDTRYDDTYNVSQMLKSNQSREKLNEQVKETQEHNSDRIRDSLKGRGKQIGRKDLRHILNMKRY